MRLGSLFDGIGGWMLAGVRCGITPVWASEIEPFPIEVTKRHFPWVKHLGDIKEINGAGIEPVEVIAFGSPCQGLSVAGGRGGLNDERSGLFLEAIRIIREMREATNGRYPRIIVWENVPGAFSSNRGLDFKTVLEEITESEIPMPLSGRWATAGMVRGHGIKVAWRVLDAQYWGAPQRRKRIFLVADFGGHRAREVLFKPESLCWNFAASKSERKSVAGNATGCVSETGYYPSIARTLTARNDGSPCIDRGPEIVLVPQSFGFDTKDSIANSMPVLVDKTPPIKTNNRLGVMAFKSEQGAKAGGLGLAVDVSPTLSASAGGNTVPAIYDMTHADEVMRRVKDGIVPTLNARMGTGGNQVPVVHEFMGQKVRRLMPIECERLQGLPDGWTDGGSDTARYKAIGNGMAQCCADYVMSGIADAMKGVD